MKTSIFTAFSLSTALFLALVSSTSMATPYYKWVDQKGVTHYTKNPPPRTAKKVSKIETHGWNNSTPYQSTATQSEEASTAAQAAAKAAEEAAKHSAQPVEAPKPSATASSSTDLH